MSSQRLAMDEADWDGCTAGIHHWQVRDWINNKMGPYGPICWIHFDIAFINLIDKQHRLICTLHRQARNEEIGVQYCPCCKVIMTHGCIMIQLPKLDSYQTSNLSEILPSWGIITQEKLPSPICGHLSPMSLLSIALQLGWCKWPPFMVGYRVYHPSSQNWKCYTVILLYTSDLLGLTNYHISLIK